jgi:alkanesulfonate monooxygenase SsuD/methylene tetrahydromethanopterin reductase-like flavin-dependent oxidoreductase (luciferase family)
MRNSVKYGFVLPSGDARTAAELAQEAEAAGWDGFFAWEPVWGIDAWVALTAAAMRTERIRLGTMLTPLSRMRPWKLASESATLDNLSGGRVTIAVGLGAVDTGFEQFGEVTDRRTRAELLDEGLEIVTGLWRGQPFNYSGKHYTVREMTFSPPPPPLQQPRIPIWVVGAWRHEKSMQRALKYDGIIPSARGDDGDMRQATPDEVRSIVTYLTERRDIRGIEPKVRELQAKHGGKNPKQLQADITALVDEYGDAARPYEIIVEGTTPADDAVAAAKVVRPWAEAGATWFNEAMWGASNDATGRAQVRARIAAGPPRV